MHFFNFQLRQAPFSLDDSFVEQFVGKQPQWGPIGYITYKRTYARRIIPNADDGSLEVPARIFELGQKHQISGDTEEFWLTLVRVVEGCYQIQQRHTEMLNLKWDARKAQCSAQEMYRRAWEFKWLPPGRGLDQMGSPGLAKVGGAALLNCAFISTQDIATDFTRPFTFMADMSMLGVGVGFDVRGQGTVSIIQPNQDDSVFVVEDSREGWVAAIAHALAPYVDSSKIRSARRDYSQVRKAGARIKGFGGVSAGPDPLIQLIEVDIPRTLDANVGQPITTTSIVDIMNCIGRCVVSGNRRRSAQIALGPIDDQQFRKLKDPEVNAERMNEFGWVSNNTHFVDVGTDYSEVGEQTAKNGEPGYLWLENVRKFARMNSVIDLSDEQAMGVNPCFSGETLIGVADGRGAVSIETLATEGRDVPVYAVDKATGEVHIKWGRNPRVTGTNQTLLEIVLDDDTILRVTPNHKFLLNDGSVVEASELVPGASLPRFLKRLERIAQTDPRSLYLRTSCDTKNTSNGKRTFEHRMIAKFAYPEEWAARYTAEKKTGWISGGLVVHHKDFCKTNNAPSNLEIMTWAEHTRHHSADMAGEKNPMFGRQHSVDAKAKIGAKSSERWRDPEFAAKVKEAMNAPESKERARVKARHARREFWQRYLDKVEAITDLKTRRDGNGNLLVERTCERCATAFEVVWSKRERAFCSSACSAKAMTALPQRTENMREAYRNKLQATLHKQIQIYKDLEQALKRAPMKKEWELACKSAGVTHRTRTTGTTNNPYAISSFTDLQARAKVYNHRVKEVRTVPGLHTVFNITVDDLHTIAVVTKFGSSMECDGVFTLQCGEQPLMNAEGCNLGETFPANHENAADFRRTLKFAYLYCKTVTLVPIHDEQTNAVQMANRRVGLSMAGIVTAMKKFGRRPFLTEFCDDAYGYVRKLDRKYSRWLCVPNSVRISTVKPGGTIPKLPGAAPGLHYPHAEFYVQRMRIARGSELATALINCGYPHEPAQSDPNGTWVFEFPVREAHFTKGAGSVSMWEQLENAADMQRYWSDNAVSITVTFNPETEGKDIPLALSIFESRLKSVSFLPHRTHGYAQPPYEEISEEEWIARVSAIKYEYGQAIAKDTTDRFCDGDRCVI